MEDGERVDADARAHPAADQRPPPFGLPELPPGGLNPARTPGPKEEPRYALRALLLGRDPRSRRVRPLGAGGSGSGLYRCRPRTGWGDGDVAPARRRGRRASAFRSALPQSGGGADRSDRQHPPLSRAAPRPRPDSRGRVPLGASIAADDRRSGGRGSRYPPPDRQQPLLRGPAP